MITIHDLPQDVSLDGLKKHVRMKVPGACLKAGFFWMNSKGKQLHVLNSDQDLSEAKRTGEQGTMRLAVVVDSGMNAVFAKILKILQFLNEWKTRSVETKFVVWTPICKCVTHSLTPV